MTGFKQFLGHDRLMMNLAADVIVRDCRRWLNDSRGIPIYRGINLSSKNTIDPMEAKRLAQNYDVDDAVLNDFAFSDYDLSDIIIKLDVNKERQPLDSPEWLHDAINEKMKKDFGIPFRSQSLFALRSADRADYYGIVYTVFPIGDYDYAWSMLIGDATHALYGWVESDGPFHDDSWHDLDSFPFKLQELMRDSWKDFLEKEFEPGYTGTNFKSFVYEMRTDSYIRSKFVEHFIATNDLWKYNTGLQQILTNGLFKDHELMISADSYYAVPFRENVEKELFALIQRKLQDA